MLHRPSCNLPRDSECHFVDLRKRNDRNRHYGDRESDRFDHRDDATIADVSTTGFDGTFVVTAIPTSTTFTYTAGSSGLGTNSSAGGTAQPTPPHAVWSTRAPL